PPVCRRTGSAWSRRLSSSTSATARAAPACCWWSAPAAPSFRNAASTPPASRAAIPASSSPAPKCPKCGSRPRIPTRPWRPIPRSIPHRNKPPGGAPVTTRMRAMATGVLAAALLWPLHALAEIEVTIPDVSQAIETNVRAFLSLTRYAERDDVTEDVMSRLQRRIVSETREALEPLGYYEPDVTYEVHK